MRSVRESTWFGRKGSGVATRTYGIYGAGSDGPTRTTIGLPHDASSGAMCDFPVGEQATHVGGRLDIVPAVGRVTAAIDDKLKAAATQRTSLYPARPLRKTLLSAESNLVLRELTFSLANDFRRGTIGLHALPRGNGPGESRRKYRVSTVVDAPCRLQTSLLILIIEPALLELRERPVRGRLREAFWSEAFWSTWGARPHVGLGIARVGVGQRLAVLDPSHPSPESRKQSRQRGPQREQSWSTFFISKAVSVDFCYDGAPWHNR